MNEHYAMMRDGLQVRVLGFCWEDFVWYLRDVRKGNWKLESVNTPNRYAIQKFDEKRNVTITKFLSKTDVERAWNEAGKPPTTDRKDR